MTLRVGAAATAAEVVIARDEDAFAEAMTAVVIRANIFAMVEEMFR